MADRFLAPRTALVTGSTSGIGLAIACGLASAGAKVAINGLGTPGQIDAAQHAVPLAEMPTQKWNDILAINLSAAFHTMRVAMPGMAARGYGRVVNIASVHGLVASVNKAPYVASKFGIVGLSKVAALEYAASGSRDSGGITVNCICPGWVETALIEPQIEARRNGGSREDGVRALVAEKQPSQRMSLPEDIASLTLWLCRREAHNVTGASFPIDGGWTAQ
jgi:3-hydroxybutyrate dehydrogenase